MTTTDPLHPHSHDPNPEPPSPDPSIRFLDQNNRESILTLAYLASLPQTHLADCMIVSTGHDPSGPFQFGGPTLLALLTALKVVQTNWQAVEVVSGDGFGTRIYRDELILPTMAKPILLALTIDGQPLDRQAGLVRLIVPTEVDDALKQVKWIGEIRLR